MHVAMGRTKTRGWSARLVRPVTIRAGVTLRTLMEAGNIVLAAPARHQMRRDWQTAASKADARCGSGAPADVWRASGRLSVKQRPS